jgi:hypothetical protein
MIPTTEEYIALANKDDDESRERLRSDQVPNEVWEAIVHGHPELHWQVTLSKTVPPKILDLLVLSPDANARSAVARTRRISHWAFETLAADHDESVRHQIAHNQKTPVRILEMLSKDSSRLVAETAQARLMDLT